MRIEIVSSVNGRDENQDAVRVAAFENGGFAAVLCDGMGGLAYGREVAKLAADRFIALATQAWEEWARGEEIAQNGVEAAIEAVNDEIRAFSFERNARVGTTICACVRLPDGRLLTQWAGDSPAVLYRAETKSLLWLTVDDNLATKLYREGKISEEQARLSSDRNVLTAYLGSPKPLPAHTDARDWKDGDVLALMSDGALGSVERPFLLDNFLLYHNDLPKLAAEICADARQSGSEDNQSIVCVG